MDRVIKNYEDVDSWKTVMFISIIRLNILRQE